VHWRFCIIEAALMAKMAHASEEHRHVALVRGGDHFVVAD
jgi:hypothetical protein